MHNPNCAIVRQGNARAWCDCGIDPPYKPELTPEQQTFDDGRLFERRLILARLRYGVKEFRRMAEDYPKWELVAEILEEEADIIETGDY